MIDIYQVIVDWIQAFSTLAAVLVAYWAYRISKAQYKVAEVTKELSKQIFHTSYRCVIYPVGIDRDNGCWSVTFRNNGIGMAFNVKVQMHLRKRLDHSSDFIPMETFGSKVINPHSEQSYKTEEGKDLSLSIFEETPIIIQWEELSGIKNEARWYWSQNEYGKNEFILKQHERF